MHLDASSANIDRYAAELVRSIGHSRRNDRVGDQHEPVRALDAMQQSRRRGVNVKSIGDQLARQLVDVKQSADQSGVAMVEPRISL